MHLIGYSYLTSGTMRLSIEWDGVRVEMNAIGHV